MLGLELGYQANSSLNVNNELFRAIGEANTTNIMVLKRKQISSDGGKEVYTNHSLRKKIVNHRVVQKIAIFLDFHW